MLDAECWMLSKGWFVPALRPIMGLATERIREDFAMLGPIGAQELIIIFVIALIVFGPRKLPQLGKSLGRSIGEFKRASNELRSTLEQEIRVEETRKEIMEPIETISNEAKEAIKKATQLDDDLEEEPKTDLEDAPPPKAHGTYSEKTEEPPETKV
jgi:sec-independent protein translocase protein TatA